MVYDPGILKWWLLLMFSDNGIHFTYDGSWVVCNSRVGWVVLFFRTSLHNVCNSRVALVSLRVLFWVGYLMMVQFSRVIMFVTCLSWIVVCNFWKMVSELFVTFGGGSIMVSELDTFGGGSKWF